MWGDRSQDARAEEADKVARLHRGGGGGGDRTNIDTFQGSADWEPSQR